MDGGALTITKADLLAAVQQCAAAALAQFLAGTDAAAIRARLVEEATCVSAEQVGEMWGMSPRAARDELKKRGVVPKDFGHRTPRYLLTAVRALVVPPAAAAAPTPIPDRKPTARIIEFTGGKDAA